MIVFRLFEIQKTLSKNTLEDYFSKYGKGVKLFIKQDNKNQNFLFGEISFEKLDDKYAFFSKCKEHKIKASEKKDINTTSSKTKSESIGNLKNLSKIQNSLTISNPSFHFYKDKNYGKGIESFELNNNYSDLYDLNLPDAQTFKLTTIYPGLLVGSGYNHPKLNSTNEDFQLGFLFDHTTGLPIISGSSIKGLLRSVFEETKFVADVYSKYYKDFMNIDVFEKGQIIFYDAFIVSSQNENNKIFGSDYITPHKNNDSESDIPDEFCEPNPIKFLKVLPAVTFKFQFKLVNEETLSTANLHQYIELFKQIILDFGLGAKTNVGYGKFQE